MQKQNQGPHVEFPEAQATQDAMGAEHRPGNSPDEWYCNDDRVLAAAPAAGTAIMFCPNNWVMELAGVCSQPCSDFGAGYGSSGFGTCFRPDDTYGKGCCCVHTECCHNPFDPSCYPLNCDNGCCGCPSGFTDTGCTCERYASTQTRSTQSRSASALQCRSGWENIGGVCYRPCADQFGTGYYRSGLLCYQPCPKDSSGNSWTNCGVGGSGTYCVSGNDYSCASNAFSFTQIFQGCP